MQCPHTTRLGDMLLVVTGTISLCQFNRCQAFLLDNWKTKPWYLEHLLRFECCLTCFRFVSRVFLGNVWTVEQSKWKDSATQTCHCLSKCNCVESLVHFYQCPVAVRELHASPLDWRIDSLELRRIDGGGESLALPGTMKADGGGEINSGSKDRGSVKRWRRQNNVSTYSRAWLMQHSI